MIATAINPGSSTVPNPPLPAIIPAMGLPPPLICGITYVNTNRNSSGFIAIRIRKGAISRRNTRRSRSNNPANARE